MSLTDRPRPSPLEPGSPFLLVAWWFPPETVEPSSLHIAISERPGIPPHEFVVHRPLADPIAEVERSELPIALQLVRKAPSGAWAFEYLGGPEHFAPPQAIPAPAQPELYAPVFSDPPRPQTADELSAGAEAMLRESLGIPPGAPIPEPQGPLPPEERGSQPYRFDPRPHMDLNRAEAAPQLPPPAPPGPAPLPGGQTFAGPSEAEVPRRPPLGSYGDQSVPFAH